MMKSINGIFNIVNLSPEQIDSITISKSAQNSLEQLSGLVSGAARNCYVI